MDFTWGGVQIRISSGRQVSDMPLNSLQDVCWRTRGELGEKNKVHLKVRFSASVRHRSGGAKN